MKGAEPSAVYWRRRAIVAGAVVVLILLIVVAVKALGAGGEAGAEGGPGAAEDWVTPSISSTLKRPYVSGSPSDEPSPEPAESSAEPVAECEPSDLMLQVVAGFEEVRSGSEVPVSVLVASGADAVCTVGLESVEVELAAGSDVVYSTAHCDPPEAETVELDEGSGRTVEFRFEALASEPGCEGDRRRLPAGDYELRARLGEAESQPASLRLN